MWKKRLAQVFALLLLLQSIAALADVHQSHQSGAEHLTFNHDHYDGLIIDKDKVNQKVSKTNSDFDCHHCCHCHSVHHHWIVVSLNLPQPSATKEIYLKQRYSLPPSPFELRLRPPISI